MIVIEKESFLDVSNDYKIGGAYIEVTTECNLRCLHCYNNSGESNYILNIDSIKNILSSIPIDNPESSITISGGEPLLHPKLFDLIDIIAEKNIPKKLLITNAQLMNQEIAKKLMQKNFNIQVSLNGSCSDIHDILCGKGSFERTMAGLQYFIDGSYQQFIVIRFSLGNFNKYDVIPFLKLMKSKGFFNIIIAFLSDVGRAVNNTDKLKIPLLQVENVINDLNNSDIIKQLKASGMNIKLPTASFSGGCPLIIKNENDKIELLPRIDSEGNVYLCQLFTDKIYSFGNVNFNTLQEILNSSDFSKLIWFLRFGIDYIHECKDCIWQSICGKGCIAMCLNNGSIQETDGDCYFRKNKILEDFQSTQDSIIS